MTTSNNDSQANGKSSHSSASDKDSNSSSKENAKVLMTVHNEDTVEAIITDSVVGLGTIVVSVSTVVGRLCALVCWLGYRICRMLWPYLIGAVTWLIKSLKRRRDCARKERRGDANKHHNEHDPMVETTPQHNSHDAHDPSTSKPLEEMQKRFMRAVIKDIEGKSKTE